MALFIECIIACALMWLICFLGTGSDEKNLKNLSSYPEEVQKKIREDEKFKDKITKPNMVVSFVSNVIIFSIIFFVFGIFLKHDNFLYTFVELLILGQVVNLFDLLVVDMLWWRNIKRIRFSTILEKAPYQSMKLHVYSFLRAIVMFTLVALIDSGLLLLLN